MSAYLNDLFIMCFKEKDNEQHKLVYSNPEKSQLKMNSEKTPFLQANAALVSTEKRQAVPIPRTATQVAKYSKRGFSLQEADSDDNSETVGEE